LIKFLLCISKVNSVNLSENSKSKPNAFGKPCFRSYQVKLIIDPSFTGSMIKNFFVDIPLDKFF